MSNGLAPEPPHTWILVWGQAPTERFLGARRASGGSSPPYGEPPFSWEGRAKKSWGPAFPRVCRTPPGKGRLLWLLQTPRHRVSEKGLCVQNTSLALPTSTRRSGTSGSPARRCTLILTVRGVRDVGGGQPGSPRAGEKHFPVKALLVGPALPRAFAYRRTDGPS